MTNKDEALKMAIEALKNTKFPVGDKRNDAITACKEALEQPAQENCAHIGMDKCPHEGICQYCKQPAQEPVGFVVGSENYPCINVGYASITDSTLEVGTPLYTHPHQWQGLTDDEIKELSRNNKCWMNAGGNLMFDWEYFGRAIEAKLKEKNK